MQCIARGLQSTLASLSLERTKYSRLVVYASCKKIENFWLGCKQRCPSFFATRIVTKRSLSRHVPCRARYDHADINPTTEVQIIKSSTYSTIKNYMHM